MVSAGLRVAPAGGHHSTHMEGGTTTEGETRLRWEQHATTKREMARREGLEPPTLRFEA